MATTPKGKAEERSDTEFLKAVSDHLKHITTLSSGFILVMAVFLERVLKTRLSEYLIPVSFTAFVTAILFAALAQVYYVGFLRLSDEQLASDPRPKLAGFLTTLAWISFVTGVVSLAVFSVKNLT